MAARSGSSVTWRSSVPGSRPGSRSSAVARVLAWPAEDAGVRREPARPLWRVVAPRRTFPVAHRWSEAGALRWSRCELPKRREAPPGLRDLRPLPRRRAAEPRCGRRDALAALRRGALAAVDRVERRFLAQLRRELPGEQVLHLLGADRRATAADQVRRRRRVQLRGEPGHRHGAGRAGHGRRRRQGHRGRAPEPGQLRRLQEVGLPRLTTPQLSAPPGSERAGRPGPRAQCPDASSAGTAAGQARSAGAAGEAVKTQRRYANHLITVPTAMENTFAACRTSAFSYPRG